MNDSAASRDPLDLQLPGNRTVPAANLVWRATTSGGPGGQHANRTASRVEIVVQISQLPLEPREIARLYERLASRISGAGEIVVACSEHRDQLRNRKVALRRMERLLADALHVAKRRIPTRISHGAKLRRRSSKQQQGQRKQARRSRWDEED